MTKFVDCRKANTAPVQNKEYILPTTITEFRNNKVKTTELLKYNYNLDIKSINTLTKTFSERSINFPLKYAAESSKFHAYDYPLFVVEN